MKSQMTMKHIREILKEHVASLGRIGGKKTALRGKAYYQEIQKKSVASRKAKKLSPDLSNPISEPLANK